MGNYTAAETPLVPSPTAAKLASLIPPDASVFVGARSLQETEKSIERRLLQTTAAWLGPSCDWESEGCKTGGREVASRYAPLILRDQQETARELYARVFETRMSEPQREQAIKFSATEPGQVFLKALALVSNPYNNVETFRAIAKDLTRKQAFSERTMIEAIYEATKKLPRRYHIAPAPIQIPLLKKQ